jgi:hypothetical protein
VFNREPYFYVWGDRDERGGHSGFVESGTTGAVDGGFTAVAVEATGGVEGVVREGESGGGVSGERSLAAVGGE